MKYLRRQDLGVETRMEIALKAYLSQGIYGLRTRLTTLYKSQLPDCFELHQKWHSYRSQWS